MTAEPSRREPEPARELDSKALTPASDSTDRRRRDFSRPPTLWRRVLNPINLITLAFALMVLGSLPVLRGSGRNLDHWGNLVRFLGRFFPPDFSDWRYILAALGETVQIAVMSTLFAFVLSVPLAVAASQNMSPRIVVRITRFLLNCIRTIPSLVWALIAVSAVGSNALAGVIGLTFYGMGYLGKFFSDAFESVNADTMRGLRTMGAGRWQAFQYGLWPHAKPLIWSHTLWMLEYNVRAASIIGYVGAGGLGLLLHSYQEYGQWDRVCALLLFVLAVVIVLDAVGEWLRARVTS
ncbi:MAG: phosphonate ABC transporter, permease protein PhnE [Candidatus Methylacidiphilales bacterium]|nr:phosphonate ABC transporter, permease protein PhnE [Candidatus Methylacidiphilales bacterium]